MIRLTKAKSSRRERWSWYLFDFGNSAYSAIILLAVYSAYFKGTVVGGAEGSRLWGLSVGIAMLAVALTSPWLGALADFSGTKKRFMAIFAWLSIICTALLFFVEQGNIFLGMLLFILAEFGYRSAQVFYNSLLPELASGDEIGPVSGAGWAVGSLGGILSLVLILPMILLSRNTPQAQLFIRLSLVATAVFYAVFCLPLLLFFREKAKPQTLPQGETYLTIGFKRLVVTFGKVKRFRQFVRFLASFLFYNNGIITTLDFSSILATVLFGFNQTQLIILMIILHLTNTIGGYLFGQLTERIKLKGALITSLLCMIVVLFLIMVVQNDVGFYIIAGLAGFAMAGVQSISRGMVAAFAPEGQSAEFYGIATVAGSTTFVGPAVFGWVAAAAAVWYENRAMEVALAEIQGLKVAILTIVAFLVVGLFILFTVSEKKAIAAARGDEAAL